MSIVGSYVVTAGVISVGTDFGYTVDNDFQGAGSAGSIVITNDVAGVPLDVDFQPEGDSPHNRVGLVLDGGSGFPPQNVFDTITLSWTGSSTGTLTFNSADADFAQGDTSQVLWQWDTDEPGFTDGDTIDVTLTVGPTGVTIPDVTGDSLSSATSTLDAASSGPIVISVGAVSFVASDEPPGQVISQDPVGDTVVTVSTAVDLVLSAFANEFDVDQTVIAQYANSPQLLAMVEQYPNYYGQQANMAQFYNFIWNVMTAVGFGLTIWGKLVNVPRVLSVAGSNVTLTDEQYLPLILAKAFANIIQTNIPALNVLLQKLFPGQRAYVQDNLNMSLSYVFEFVLSPLQIAIVNAVVPHPAGVGANIISIDTGTTFGFEGSGLEGFEVGVFAS